MLVEMQEIYNKLQKYANSNYESEGWDIFVECYDYNEFVAEVMQAKLDISWQPIYDHFKAGMKQLDSHRRDIEAEAF